MNKSEIIDKDAFKDALLQIDDGFVFENFAQSFLNAYLGHSFIPIGGSKDKGLDGFEHIFHRTGKELLIYQMSTEKNTEDKIRDTLMKLEGTKEGYNKKEYQQLFYITNRKVNNKDTIIDNLYEEFSKPITIFDNIWFTSNCNHSDGTIRAFNTFVDSYLHEYQKPGKSFVVADLDKDSRLYVFLRQQLESRGEEQKLDEVLADTLILFLLEGTDPDKNILMTANEIKTGIREYIKFDYNTLSTTVDNRLVALSTKPKKERKIRHHTKENAYVLIYETRKEIQKRNLADKTLVDEFEEQTTIQLKKYLRDEEVVVRDILVLISNTVHKIFYQQGLEFSNFILNNDSRQVLEYDLQQIVNQVVDESSIVSKNKEKVKSALLVTIREIAYHGSIEQKQYLRSLSNTYMMMFMLHWDPKISIFFQSMASKLNIYVCNSIIIPALSESYLNDENKRHWNLLKGAQHAGISLRINETILDELISHFRMIVNKYHTFFAGVEDTYLGDDMQMLYIDEILIRAYFYAKSDKLVSSFEDFINNFLNSSLKTAKNDLISYLNEVFGILYIPNKDLSIKLNEADIEALAKTLEANKSHKIKAKNDAELILAIYELRESYNETTSSSIFGYKTWWLSKDTSTYKAVIETFGEERFPVNCYIRPDFIFNYITLTPKKDEVDDTYQKLFPSLLGVNISYHLPKDISNLVQTRIKDHAHLPHGRLKAVLRELTDKLKSDPTVRNRKSVQHFLDDRIKEIENECT